MLLHKAATHFIDIIIAGLGISTIWGLSLADWDHLTKIAGTVIVTTVAVTLNILNHRKKK